jgi:hypothetical protein
LSEAIKERLLSPLVPRLARGLLLPQLHLADAI